MSNEVKTRNSLHSARCCKEAARTPTTSLRLDFTLDLTEAVSRLQLRAQSQYTQ